MILYEGRVKKDNINIDFLIIYNHLLYKYYNEKNDNKSEEYLQYMNTNDKLENIIIKLFKGQDYTQYIKTLEKILKKHINFLIKLQDKCRKIERLNISYNNYNQLNNEIASQKNTINISNMINIQKNLIHGYDIYNNNINNDKYNIIKSIKHIFDTDSINATTILSDNIKIIKNILLSENDNVISLKEKINNELTIYQKIDDYIKKTTLYSYISPFTFKMDKNRINIELDTIKFYNKLRNNKQISSIITNLSYKLIKPIITYTDNNKILNIPDAGTKAEPKTISINSSE